MTNPKTIKMEGFEKNEEMYEEMDGRFKQEIYSKAVRAGKRTYFFDVKSTRKDEYYLTITESKKHYEQDGKFHYEKHKIFLYKEDFDKFAEGLNDAIDFIDANQGRGDYDHDGYDEGRQADEPELVVAIDDETDGHDELYLKDYANIEFEDLTK